MNRNRPHHTNYVLNQKGIEQAEEVASKLEKEIIDLIICSPLVRARQTAEIINKNRNIPIRYDYRIVERDYGEYEGKSSNNFNFKEFWNYNCNGKYEYAENIESFFKRVYDFLDSLANESTEKNILIVAHGGISVVVNCYFNGIPSDGEILQMGLHNCEYAKYNF